MSSSEFGIDLKVCGMACGKRLRRRIDSGMVTQKELEAPWFSSPRCPRCEDLRIRIKQLEHEVKELREENESLHLEVEELTEELENMEDPDAAKVLWDSLTEPEKEEAIRKAKDG